MERRGWRARQALTGVLGAITLGVLVFLIVLVAGGGRVIKTSGRGIAVHHITPWLVLAAACAVAALLSLMLTGRGDGAAAARAAELEAERDREAQERRREREHDERISAAWQTEREWNRRLREQLEEIGRSQGALGRGGDIHAMVLELTMNLTDAHKGLLLTDGAGDGRRSVVASSGFASDPADSALAQRFGEEVIERDATVREDDPAQVQAAARTEADREVENLLAIPIYLAEDFSGVILCANRDGGFGELEDEVLVTVGNHAGAVLANSRLQGDLRSAYLTTVRVLTDAIELKDPELRGHSDAVSDYVLAVADQLDLDPREREELIFASLLHDVGKLGISEHILLKPAALTAEERQVIELHPRLGFDLLNQVPALARIAPAVLHHHERWDGGGYPGGLEGAAIPLAARVIAVADSFSAIVSDRPYSPAQPVPEACAELERCAGSQFDPRVVELFVAEVQRHPPVPVTREPASPPAPELAVHRRDPGVGLGSPAFGLIDPVTLLYSHRHFHETAAAEAERAAVIGRPFGVAVARLEGLDRVNRSAGYPAGEALLQGAGTVVERVAADLGTRAFRIGGRTFGLLVGDTDAAALGAAAARLERELALGLLSAGVGAGVGAALWARPDTGEDVIDRAILAAAASSAVLGDHQTAGG